MARTSTSVSIPTALNGRTLSHFFYRKRGDADYVGHDCVMVSVPIQYYDWNDNLTNGTLCAGTAYQFDWSVGKGIYFEDIMSSNTTGIPRYYCYYGIIDEIKEDYFGSICPLKYVDLDGKAPECGKWDSPQNVDTQGGRIIQGIGITEWNDGECLFGPPNPYFALQMSSEGGEPERHYRSMLVHFERNGEVLYDVWPEKGATNVKTVSKESTLATSTLYNLQGQRLTDKPRKGVYIQNGKKVVIKIN